MSREAPHTTQRQATALFYL